MTMTKQQFYVVLGYNVVLKWGCLDLPCSSKYRAFSLYPEEHGKSRLYCSTFVITDNLIFQS